MSRKPNDTVPSFTCPDCGGRLWATRDSRPIPVGIRRRKECLGCRRRITTIETMPQTSERGAPIVGTVYMRKRDIDALKAIRATAVALLKDAEHAGCSDDLPGVPR